MDLAHVCLLANERFSPKPGQHGQQRGSAASHSYMVSIMPGEKYVIAVHERVHLSKGAGGKENCQEKVWRFLFESLQKLGAPWPELQHPADLLQDRKLHNFPLLVPVLVGPSVDQKVSSKFWKDRKRCKIHMAHDIRAVRITIKPLNPSCPKKVIETLKEMFSAAGVHAKRDKRQGLQAALPAAQPVGAAPAALSPQPVCLLRAG